MGLLVSAAHNSLLQRVPEASEPVDALARERTVDAHPYQVAILARGK